MRIAMVVEPARRPELAAHGHVGELSRALVARGHRVTRYERRRDPDSPTRERVAGGVEVVRVEAGPPGALPPEQRLRVAPQLGFRLAADWAAGLPDVVHAHGWRAGLAALTAVREIPRSVRPAIVMTFHGLVAGRPHSAGPYRALPSDTTTRARLESAMAREVDRVVALSAEEAERLVSLGVGRRAVDVIPTGVDTEVFTPAPRPRTVGPVRLLAADRLAPSGWLDLAVRALAAAPGAELAVLPARPVRPDDVRRLFELARRCGVASRIRLLEPVPHEVLPDVLRSSDVLVRTRPDEPTGRLVLQAMACGVAVVGPDVGCLADAVVEGATGVLVPPADASALGRALAGVAADPVRREGYGLAAVERARTRYAWTRVAEETERAYATTALMRSASGDDAATGPGAGPVATGS